MKNLLEAADLFCTFFAANC